MNPWLTLAPVLVINLAGALITYTRHVTAAWAPYALGGLAGLAGVLWWDAVRQLDPPDKVRYSIVWDVVVFAPYYAVPLLLEGVRPTPAVWAGLALITAGLFLVKHN